MILGGMELAILLMFTGGRSDLLNFVEPDHYFQSRNVPLNVQKMAELAVQSPNDPKAQVQQLLALRWLEENAEKVKKTHNFQAIHDKIEKIAQGQLAQDLQGFAKGYAQYTLVAFGDKIKIPPLVVPENSVRQDALRWFPQGATFAAVLDFRMDYSMGRKRIDAVRDQIFGMMPPDSREEFYQNLEKMGNLQMDRIAFAFQEENDRNNSRIFIRMTGKGNHEWFVDFLVKMAPDMKIEKQKAFRGKKISILQSGKGPPVFAVIGDQELIMAGFERSFDKNHRTVLDEILDVRAGKKMSLLTGPLAKTLKSVSAKAQGIGVGEIPRELREELSRRPFQVVPKTILAQVQMAGTKINLSLQAELDNAKDAKTFAEDVEKLKKMGLDALKNPPPLPANLPLPAKFYDHCRDALKSLKVEAQGNSATVTGSVSSELAGPGLLGPVFIFGAVAQPAPKIQAAPVPVQVDKKPPGIKKPKKSSRLSFPENNRSLFLATPQLTISPEVVIC